MAYDEDLADRVRVALSDADDVNEKRMFGGLAFLVAGNMAVAVSGKGGLLLRCAPEQTVALVSEDHVEHFEMRGRTMDGWLHVLPEAADNDESLQRWVDIGVARAQALPAK